TRAAVSRAIQTALGRANVSDIRIGRINRDRCRASAHWRLRRRNTVRVCRVGLPVWNRRRSDRDPTRARIQRSRLAEARRSNGPGEGGGAGEGGFCLRLEGWLRIV